jgi:hypothetical protein
MENQDFGIGDLGFFFFGGITNFALEGMGSPGIRLKKPMPYSRRALTM